MKTVARGRTLLDALSIELDLLQAVNDDEPDSRGTREVCCAGMCTAAGWRHQAIAAGGRGIGA